MNSNEVKKGQVHALAQKFLSHSILFAYSPGGGGLSVSRYTGMCHGFGVHFGIVMGCCRIFFRYINYLLFI